MRKLVYVSRAKRKEAVTLDALTGLLGRAREVNDAHGVTGALFYDEGMFLQILEGKPEAVQYVLERVRRDPRHEALWILCDVESPVPRLFPSWHMGFYHLSSVERLIGVGLVQNDGDALSSRLQALAPNDVAGRLLKNFWTENRDCFVK